MAEQNPAEQQFDPAALPDGDAPPQPVTVEVETPDTGETPPADAAETPAAKPPRPRPQQRIQNLTHERDEARNYAEQMRRELEAARQQAAQERSGREQAERAGMENYGARVKSEITAAERELIAAKESGDVTAEVAAQKKIAKAAAAEADYDAWATTQPKPGEQRQQQPAQQQPQQQQPRPQAQETIPDEATLQFLDENRWFDAFERTQDGRIATDRAGRPVANPDFDESMHDAALIIHKRIERDVRLGKKSADYLASPEYFQEISDGISQNFPDAFENQETPAPQTRKTPPMSQSRQPVAPANRTFPNTNGNRMASSSKITLDGEQAALVRSLVDNGTLKYPRNHPDVNKRGQKMDYKDAYVDYAKNMQRDQADKASGNRQ